MMSKRLKQCTSVHVSNACVRFNLAQYIILQPSLSGKGDVRKLFCKHGLQNSLLTVYYLNIPFLNSRWIFAIQGLNNIMLEFRLCVFVPKYMRGTVLQGLAAAFCQFRYAVCWGETLHISKTEKAFK